MAITTTTHDLSLDKVLTNMLNSARNLAEKTEREDGDWRVISTTRSVFYDYKRDLFVLKPKFGHTIAVGQIPDRVMGRTSQSDVEERLNGLSRWVARNRVEIINSHNRVGTALDTKVDGSTELTVERIASSLLLMHSFRLFSGHYHPDALKADDIERFATYFSDWRELAKTRSDLSGLVEDEEISAKLDAVAESLGDRIVEEVVDTRRLEEFYSWNSWTSGYAKILTSEQFLRAASIASETQALHLAAQAVELYDLYADDLSAESLAWMKEIFDWGMTRVTHASIGYEGSMSLAKLSYALGGPRLVFNTEAYKLYGRSRRFRGYCILTPVQLNHSHLAS